jgi:SH3-like domain-containing protein
MFRHSLSIGLSIGLSRSGSCLRATRLLLLLAGLVGLAAPLVAAENKPSTQLLPPKGAIASPSAPKTRLGSESKLPVPRFVSLKSGRINVRRGPGPDNQILWVFEKKGLPVEITAESGRWRRIRDREGDVGWVWHSMLDGRRTAVVTGHDGNTAPVALQAEPDPSANVVAYAEVGVIAQIKLCKGAWCELQASGYEGWIPRSQIWGTYVGETVE